MTPATHKCCTGLAFGCLDSFGGTSCQVRANIVYQFCYDPANPLWRVELPHPGGRDAATNYSAPHPDRDVRYVTNFSPNDRFKHAPIDGS